MVEDSGVGSQSYRFLVILPYNRYPVASGAKRNFGPRDIILLGSGENERNWAKIGS